MRDAAVPGGTGTLESIASQRAGLRVVELHVELRAVFERLSGADYVELRFRIVGTRLPDAAATRLPRVVVVFPAFAARVAGLRHGIEAPQLVAVLHVERGNPSARARVSGTVLDDHPTLGH